MKIVVCCALTFLFVLHAAFSAGPEPVSWFSTDGETIYHLTGARTSDAVPRSIIAAAYSGKVLCFDFASKRLWEQAAGQSFPFDLDAGDIDGDGFDECAAASADGSLYLIDHDGQLLAKVFAVKPFLHMRGKGILLGPQSPEAMLSLSPVGLGIRPPSDQFVQTSHNSHRITTYQSDPPWVFSRLECFWGKHRHRDCDFGYYGIGRRRQAPNFVPKSPYGLMPIVPSDANLREVPGVERLLATDAESWFDEHGQRYSAKEYASEVEDTLRAASARTFLQVLGDVAWTATRIDKSHVRLVLIDPGYLAPADRDAEITVNAEVVSATDILSREVIPVRSNVLTATVPMGVLRVIDIEHRGYTP